ncbi:MAG: hypothetical protein KAY37_05140 [Phycisphaerae bacterium]|nr:hypothetical protein [Phycisphaerae bacterium]
MKFLFTLLLLIGPQVTPEQIKQSEPSAEQRERQTPSVLDIIEHASRQIFAGLEDDGGWDEHGGYMITAYERLYEVQGWDSEPDLFTLDVIREVGAIPPWQVRERFDALAARYADRYLLDEEQEQVYREMVERESIGLFVRHASQLLPDVLEAVQTRLAREPITAEQVERWSKEMAPVFMDMRDRIDVMTAELMENLDPEQQELFLVDLEALNHRLDRLDEMGAAWWEGDWKPEDWGMDRDPIQLGERRPDRTDKTEPGYSGEDAESGAPASNGVSKPLRTYPPPPGDVAVSTQPTSRPAEELEAWAKYVRDFIRRYGLNDDQQRRAWTIYDNARQRRTFHQRRYDRKIERHQHHAAAMEDEKLRQRLTEIEESWSSTRKMIFEGMKRRLERLPTRRQRRAAIPTTRPGK